MSEPKNTEQQLYDTIIIGSGPAGMTAGIYAARREMSALMIGKEPGGQIMWASEIENYPGFRSISNHELIGKMQHHVTDLGVKTKNEEVKKIAKDENGDFQLTTGGGTFYGKTVIIAMGLSPRRLEIPGEKEFAGKGVTYCANCDAPFYKNKDVAVIGGGNSALDAAEYLSKIANKVYLVHRREEFRGFEALIEEVKDKENIELVLNSEVKSIKGEETVERIKVHNKKQDADSDIEVQGVFIEIGRIANTDLVEDLVERNESSQIKVNDRCETATPGIYAAGDVTTVPFKQITIACGQGTIAALAAYQYIQENK
jgi:alkyl hydroperoxide reductase subunit F